MVDRPQRENVCEFASRILIIVNKRKMKSHSIYMNNSFYVVWGYVERVKFEL